MFWCILLIFFAAINNLRPADTTYNSNSSLSSDTRLTSSSRAIFDATLTLDGSNFALTFPHTNDQVLVINNGFTATLTNILLDRFSPSNLSLGAGSSIIFGNNSYVTIFKNDSLNYTWKFSGTSTLDGQNKMISLGSSGIIEAQASSTLTLKDLTLYDVNGTNLRCLDNSASIIFNNVKIINRNRWRFQNGAFAVTNNLSMLGGGIFSYESAYASTINDNSNLLFTDNMTFSYDPAKGSGQAVAGQQNLAFTNTSSKLICDGVTLKITNTGMKVTKGTIQFDRQNSIYSDANINDKSRGLIIGQSDISTDAQIIAGPGAIINLESGVINYQNAEAVLKYGDGVVLRHKTYGFYWYWSTSVDTGAGQKYIFGNPAKTIYGQFYVEPAFSSFRYGTTPEQPVFTGDPIRLENMVDNTNLFSVSVYPYPPQVSAPQPPYGSMTIHNQPTGTIEGGCRFYKKSGSVGQKIFIGDEIYIFRYSGTFNTVGYIGSTNNTFLSVYKEIINYDMQSLTTNQPPNMDNDYIWIIDTIIEKAYLSGPANTSIYTLPSGSIPPAANYQF